MKGLCLLNHLLFLFLSWDVFAEEFDYCKSFCGKKPNVACGCKLENPSCQVQDENLADFRQMMVDEHNRLRNKFASGEESYADNMTAANMHVLNYDLDLEYTAVCQSRKCDHKHDGCHVTEKFKTSGQNLFWSSVTYTTPKEFTKAIGAWYKEVKMLKLGSTHAEIVDKFHSAKGIGHFTQLIWAKSTHIGCSRVWDPDSPSPKNWMLTCNYGPVGNVIGGSIFAKGEPCSQCGSEKCNEKYTGLCGKLEAIPGDSVGLGGQDHLVPKMLILLFTLIVAIV